MRSRRIFAKCKTGGQSVSRFRFGAPAAGGALAVMSGSLTTFQPSDNLVVNVMQRGGTVLVGELGSTVADDDSAIGSVADRCLPWT
jgi:hypothetical protein